MGRGSLIGVVIATRDRSASLLRTLARLSELPERPAIVVVDNASSDGTVDAVRRRFAEITVIPLDENLGAYARTIGARQLDVPFVAFSDDDSWWAPGALARATVVLERRPQLALVAARILVGPEQRDDATCTLMASSRLPAARGLPGRPVLGFVACGAVVRRSAFLAVGGFERRLLLAGEERLLAVELASAGWELAYLADVVAHHHPSPLRDPGVRRQLEARNALWISWLRRPLGSAGLATASVLVQAARNPHALAGLVQACRGIPWVLRERRPISRELDVQLRALES